MSRHAKELKIQITRLLDDILEVRPQERDLLFVRVFFETQVSEQVLMNEFIKWVLPWEKEIMKQNDRYFYENDHIFGPLPIDKVNHFRRLWKNGEFDSTDKTVIWAYLKVFVKLAKLESTTTVK